MLSQTCKHKIPLLTVFSKISIKKGEFLERKVSFELEK